MFSTTYLITGANRGIGRGLTAALLSRQNTTVIAAVRDPNHETAKSLSSLPTGENSKVVTVKIDATVSEDAEKAVTGLKATYKIDKIDIVIASAGISKYYGPLATTPISEFEDHYKVNVIGPAALFQATWPLLEKSEKPMFVGITSGVGSITDMFPIPAGAYGSSKASLNYIVRKIHFENEKLIAFPINPGWVQTDMGALGAAASGLKEAPVTLDDCINGLLDKIDNATREKTSGTFQDFEGAKFNW